MADQWLVNEVRAAAEKVEDAHKRIDQVAPLVHELIERLEKQEGEMKALKMRLGKRAEL